MKTVLASLVAAVTALAAASAHAETTPAPAPAGSYHFQILAADAAAFGLFFGGVLAQGPDGRDTFASDSMMAAGALSFPLGAPIVHLVHGQGWRAAGSLALRLGVPLLGGAIGAGTATCTEHDFLCGLPETGIGILVGSVVAAFVDGAFLARAPDGEEPPAPRGLASLSPRLTASHTGAVLGLGGNF